jgi:energy-coupling factor transporter ATP-binding protein EcfA2
MRRVKLRFAGFEVEFADRDRGVQQVLEWAEKGTWHPIVVFGPEGCGKTAWLRQAAAILREEGFEVFYLHPLDRLVYAEVSAPGVREAFLDLARRALAEEALGRVAWAIFDFVRDLLKVKRSKVAILADDVFQAIGLERAAAYVKGLLNTIEHPVYDYEKMVVIVATSEGLSRSEIGRHRWATLMPMWNMGRRGFEELYERLPGPKPELDEVWRLTGGNPGALAELYEARWRPERVVEALAERKRLGLFAGSLSPEERGWLAEAVEDPDTLFARERIPLMDKLVELNLVVDSVYPREPWLWIDEPPPERDLELSIGKRVAWQTPLHREAVRKALEEVRG